VKKVSLSRRFGYTFLFFFIFFFFFSFLPVAALARRVIVTMATIRVHAPIVMTMDAAHRDVGFEGFERKTTIASDIPTLGR